MKSSRRPTRGTQKPLRGAVLRPFVSNDEVDKKVAGCISAVYDLLTIHGMNEDASTARAFASTHIFWRKQVARLENDWVAYAKYKLASFIHAVTDQLAPPPALPVGLSREDNTKLIQGRPGSYLHKLLGTDLRDSIIAGIGIGVKKGMPRPDEGYLSRGATKAFAALTTEHKQPPDVPSLDGLANPDWGDAAELPREVEDTLDRRSSLRQVRRLVNELFAGTSFTGFVTSKNSRPFPSTSSTNTSTRKDGGGFADVQAAADALGLIFDEPMIRFSLEPDTPDVAFARLAAIGEADVVDPVHEVYSADPTLLHRRYDMLYNAVRAAYEEGQLDNEVDIVALSEALKVRTITKGNGLRNFLLAPLQQFLWSRLASHPLFKLIGKPLEEIDILDALGRRLNDGRAFLSGDYSAATDNLAPWLSEAIADEISRTCHLPVWMARLFREALTGHMIRDPDSPNILPQVWGQLMGSVVSFPVLCIANALVCRWTIEQDLGRTVPLNQLKLLINGDDCLFRLRPRYLPVWEAIARYHGLTPSVGKFYLSYTLVQMNSMNFTIKHHWVLTRRPDGTAVARDCPYNMVGYVNLGLFYGLGRTSSSKTKRAGKVVEESVRVEDVVFAAARCREMLRISPVSMRCSLMSRYLQFHRESFSRVAGSLPWFVPQALGGLGLPCFGICPDAIESPERFARFQALLDRGLIFEATTSEALKWCPTDLDRRTVGAIIDSGHAPGPIKMDSSLPIRDASSQYIPVKPVIGVSDAFDGESVQAQACLEVLFRKRLKVKDFVGTVEKLFARRGRAWAKQQRRGLGQRRSLLTVLEAGQQTYLPIRLERAVAPYRFPAFVQPLVGWEDVAVDDDGLW